MEPGETALRAQEAREITSATTGNLNWRRHLFQFPIFHLRTAPYRPALGEDLKREENSFRVAAECSGIDSHCFLFEVEHRAAFLVRLHVPSIVYQQSSVVPGQRYSQQTPRLRATIQNMQGAAAIATTLRPIWTTAIHRGSAHAAGKTNLLFCGAVLIFNHRGWTQASPTAVRIYPTKPSCYLEHRPDLVSVRRSSPA